MGQANSGAVVTDYDRTLAITTIKAGVAMEPGDLVGCTEATPPTLVLADANVGAGTGRVLGVCTESVVAGQYPAIVRSGYVRGLSGLSPGKLQFLSAATEGARTETAPTSDGDTQQVVGVAVSASAFLIDIGPALNMKANIGTAACVNGYAAA